VQSAAAWKGAALSRSDEWIYRLDEREREQCVRLARQLVASGRSRETITRDCVELERLEPAVSAWKAELARGRGFVLVRGLPVERLTEAEAILVFWALGLHLGDPVPQNVQAELLTDIRDTGADPNDPSTRLYKTRVEQDFHTDGADIIALLCLHGAKSGGESRIVSSVTVFNELLAQRPDLAPLLFEEFHWHYFEPQMDAPIAFPRPICTDAGGGLNTFFIPWYIRRAQEVPGVPPLTAEQNAAIELMERLANDPSLYLDMEFVPGDVQLLKNSVILHKRTAYEDWPEPDRRRHLVRLWLAAPEFTDGDAQLRGGIRLDQRDAWKA